MRYRLSMLLLLLLAAPLRAGGDDFPSDFWLSSQRTAAGTAAQLIGARDPWTAAVLRVHGFHHDHWDEPLLTLDRVPPLSARRFGAVRDDAALANDESKLPEELPQEIRDENALYWQAVRYAFKVPASVFAKAAEENRYLTFGHLYTEPAKYRGKVVHFSGRLVRLKRLDPPHPAQVRGISALYEAWVFLDLPGTHPLCVIVPHAPAGVAVGDDLNVRVEVDGYFFKRYRYTSGRLDDDRQNVRLSTILLIAPTLTPKTPPVSAAWSVSPGGSLFSWLIGFAALVVVFMVGMTWWFRRSDRLVQARLRTVRAGRFAEQAAALEKTLSEPADPGNGSAHSNGTQQNGV